MNAKEDNAYRSHLEELGHSGLTQSVIDGFDAWYNSILPRNKNASILDFGCGLGDFVEYLKMRGYENITGTDINQELITIAERRTGCKFEILNDIEEFSNNNRGRYDYVHMKDVLEHIDKPDMIRYLEMLKATLKPDGFIIISCPQMCGFTSLFTLFNDFTHKTLFTERSLKYLLRSAGFSTVELIRPIIPLNLRPSALFLRIARCLWFKILRIVYFIERPGEEMPPYLGDRIVVTASL